MGAIYVNWKFIMINITFWDYLLDEIIMIIIIFWDYLFDGEFWILIKLGFLIYIFRVLFLVYSYIFLPQLLLLLLLFLFFFFFNDYKNY